MTLTVAFDDDTPTRMNITGNDLDFTITLDGTRMDIIGDDNLVDVTMDGDQGIIKWLGGGGLWSSSIANVAGNFRALHMFGETNHSLLTTEDLTGERILTSAYPNQLFRGFGFSGNYFFTLEYVNSTTGICRRFNINTLVSEDITLSDKFVDGMIVYNSNIVYVVGQTAIPWTIAVWKVDFSDDSVSQVGTFDTATTYETYEYDLHEQVGYVRCRYGALDRLVIVYTFNNGVSTTHGEIVSVCTFNLSTENEVAQVYTDGGDGVWDFLDQQYSGIHQYQDKAVFNLAVEDVENGYEGTLCDCPFFVVNLSTGGLYRGDGHGQAYPGWFEQFQYWSAMDHTNGVYYFGTYEFYSDKFRLLKSTISSFSPSAVLSAGDAVQFTDPISGTENVYVRYWDHATVPAVDDLTTVTLSPTLADMLIASKSVKVVDDDDDMVWALSDNLSNLEGFSTLVGGSDTNLSIGWGTNTPPADSICKLIMPYRGYCAILLYSAGVGPSQGWSLYMLRPLV